MRTVNAQGGGGEFDDWGISKMYRRPLDWQKIIYCHNHKTAPQDAAKVIINNDTESTMELYYEVVRKRATPKEGVTHLFFLTATGARYTQEYWKMNEAFSAANIDNFKLPAPSGYQILVAQKNYQRSLEMLQSIYEPLNRDSP